MDCKNFIVGLSLGMLGGALLVANSRHLRRLIKDGQEQIRRKADEMSKNDCCCGEQKCD